LHTTHFALWQPEEIDDRRQLAEEVVELAERVGDHAMQLEGRLLHLWCLLDAGEFAGAERELEAAARLNAGVRQPYYAWCVAIARTCLAFAGGRVGEVEALAAEALSLGHQAQNPSAVVFFAIQVGSLYWLAGRSADVEGVVKTIVETFPHLGPVVQCALADSYADGGRFDDARVVFEDAMTKGEWRKLRNIAWLPALAYLAETCAALRDVRRAEELSELLRPYEG